MHINALAVVAAAALFSNVSAWDFDDLDGHMCGPCNNVPREKWGFYESWFCDELIENGFCDLDTPPSTRTTFEYHTHTVTDRRRDVAATPTSVEKMVIPHGQHMPQAVCERFPEGTRPAGCSVTGEAAPSKVRARRWETETSTVTMRIYETETSTVMSIPTWCLPTLTATHPAPTTWPAMTTPAPPPHTELPPPVWTIPAPPPHFEPPPPVWHTPAPSPPQSPVVSESTTSVVTITSQACTTCTPHIWTSTVSLPLSPVPTPSSSHSIWSSPSSASSAWSSAPPLYPSTSVPVHSSTTTPAASSPSTTISYSHTTHTYGTMKPIYTHPTSITPPVLGGVGKVEGSVLAMLAFVAAAVVIPAL